MMGKKRAKAKEQEGQKLRDEGLESEQQNLDQTGEDERSTAEEGQDEARAESCELEDLASELEALKAEHKEQAAQYLRLSAEFDNFRRRSRREQEELHQRAVCSVSTQWLPLIDNLQRGVEALKQQGAQAEAIEGLELILRQTDEVLKKLEIEPIPTDIPFDPNLHEAILHVEEEGREAGEIVEVFQIGYQRQGQVLRHSVVKVAN